MYPSPFHKGAVAGSQIEIVRTETLTPSMFVAIGKHEEQALHLDAAATLQQSGKAAGTQRGEPLKHHIEIVEAFMVRQFVQRFEDRAFG
jgi:hypothetical protein